MLDMVIEKHRPGTALWNLHSVIRTHGKGWKCFLLTFTCQHKLDTRTRKARLYRRIRWDVCNVCSLSELIVISSRKVRRVC